MRDGDGEFFGERLGGGSGKDWRKRLGPKGTTGGKDGGGKTPGKTRGKIRGEKLGETLKEGFGVRLGERFGERREQLPPPPPSFQPPWADCSCRYTF